MTPLPCRRLVALVAVLVGAIPAAACPFCTMQGQTLTGDVNQASMVLFGTLKNPKLGGDGPGSTEFHVEAVIKKHDILGDKKVVLLPRYVPPSDKDKNVKFLIFCDIFKGKIDPYRGIPVKGNADIVKYLTGAVDHKDKPLAERLSYFFNYLDNPDLEISNDAYKEFGNADYKDYRDLAKKLPADRIAKWLEDPDTPSFRFGLYASMLGHCGSSKHASLLRQMLDDPKRKVASGVDGILAGYIMLDPKNGWEYLLGILKDSKKDFLYRYAGLRAVRFFVEQHTDAVPKAELLKGTLFLADQGDIADLAIDDLRKWKSWEALNPILALAGKESHDVPIVRRAILKFALSCPDKKAAAFVAAERKKDADFVKEVEELLQLETKPSK